MQSFSTEFPVQQSITAADFSAAVREWLLGSRYSLLNAQSLEGLGNSDDWSYTSGSETIESLGTTTLHTDDIAVRYRATRDNLEWLTSMVFSAQPSSTWVSVRVTCESLHPAARLPAAKKPVLVRTLLNTLGGGRDGQLDVTSNPFILKDPDVDFAASCILGTTSSYLPIIYISCRFQGGHLVDPFELAKELSGMAHVVVEPNRSFSIRLMNEVKSQNVYGGTIGVYWPEGGGSRSFFIGRELESADQLEKAIFEEIRLALNNRRPLARCTWAAVTESHSRRIINQLRELGSTEVDKYIAAFSEELNAKAIELQEAENEIQRLKADIRKHEAHRPMRDGLLINTGQERDFFQGELLDIARDAFAEVVNKVPNDSRRQHVLRSFINANESVGAGQELRNRLKAVLRDYQNMDAKVRKDLEQIGFSISDGGKHFKLVFLDDDRYTFTLAKSGSDYRGGLNAAGDISRLLF